MAYYYQSVASRRVVLYSRSSESRLQDCNFRMNIQLHWSLRCGYVTAKEQTIVNNNLLSSRT